MGLIKVILYELPSGKIPYKEWFLEFDEQEKAIFTKRINRVVLGNFGDCKPIKSAKGIWELVIDYGPGYRIYFAKEKQTIVILLCAGEKKSQQRDIEKAKKYWQDYRGLEKEYE